jgi:hypothetical protein
MTEFASVQTPMPALQTRDEHSGAVQIGRTTAVTNAAADTAQRCIAFTSASGIKQRSYPRAYHN